MQQEEIGLQHYAEILWRRKWAILVVFTIVTSLGVIAISLSKTTYKVHSKVAVKNQYYSRISVLSFSEGTDAPATTLSGETYVEIINGVPFAGRVSDHLVTQGSPMDPMEIHGALNAQYQDPDLIRIFATHQKPDVAVLLANAAADVFVEDTKHTMRDELKSGRQSALGRQEKALKDAEEAESEIVQFRREMGFVEIDSEMQTLRDKIATFEQSRGEVMTKLEIAQSHHAELMNLARVGTAGDLYLDDPRLEEYRKLQEAVMAARIKYTDDHPVLRNLSAQVKNIEDRLKDTIARSGANLSPEAFLTLKADLAKAEAEMADLRTAINSWNRQIDEVRQQLKGYPEKLAELQVLEARALAARDSYKTWTSRIEEIDFKDSKVPGNAELVDRAIAPSPAISKTTSAMLLLIVSLMMALGAGFLVEFADTTLRTPEEITSVIGLGYLGSIVKLKDARSLVFENGKALNQVAEDYTRVYSNLKFAEVEKPIKSVLITSARKGEGKSTTLLNFACAIAAAGRRVIVVDTDLRNPSLQRILGMKHSAGLTSVLAGEMTLSEALKPTTHPGLTLLPAGPIPPNPAELLHSQAMKDVIQDLENRTDIVFFDSPPTLLVADAMLLASEMDAAIIVAESGGVSRKAVQQVKESLEAAKARLLGVILNKLLETPGTYYNYYSYYKYYREPEEEAAPQTAMGWIKDGFQSIRKTMGGRG